MFKIMKTLFEFFFVIEKDLKNKEIFRHIPLNRIVINHLLKHLKLIEIVFKKISVFKNRFVNRKNRFQILFLTMNDKILL